MSSWNTTLTTLNLICSFLTLIWLSLYTSFSVCSCILIMIFTWWFEDCKNLHNHFELLHLLLVLPVELEQEPVHDDPHGADVAVMLLPAGGRLGLAGVGLQLPRLVLDLDGIWNKEIDPFIWNNSIPESVQQMSAGQWRPPESRGCQDPTPRSWLDRR